MNEKQIFLNYLEGQDPFIDKRDYVGMNVSQRSNVFFEYFEGLKPGQKLRMVNFLVEVLWQNSNTNEKLETIDLLMGLASKYRDYFSRQTKDRLFQFVSHKDNQARFCAIQDDWTNSNDINEWRVANSTFAILVILNYNKEIVLSIANEISLKCKSKDFQSGIDLLLDAIQDGLYD